MELNDISLVNAFRFVSGENEPEEEKEGFVRKYKGIDVIGLKIIPKIARLFF